MKNTHLQMPVECTLCGEECATKYNLTRHLHRRHNVSSPIAQLAAKRKSASKIALVNEDIKEQPALMNSPEAVQESDTHLAAESPEIEELVKLELTPLSKAMQLLHEGVPNLLLPAPRKWTGENQVILPTGCPWPPAGYASMDKDMLLLLFEEQVIQLARLEKFPLESRRELFDRYTMLALPGMNFPAVEGPAQHGRDLLSQSVRDVAAGRAPLSNAATALISSLWSVPRAACSLVDEVVLCMTGVPWLLDPPAV